MAILTGFPCFLDEKPHFENDGINGAFHLGKCLASLKKKVTLIIENYATKELTEIKEEYMSDLNKSVSDNFDFLFLEYGSEPLSKASQAKLKEIKEKYGVILSIERSSLGLGNAYYTMKCIDVSSLVCPVD